MTKQFLYLLFLLLVGCVTVPSSQERKTAANRLATDHRWHAIVLPTEAFDLTAYIPYQISAGRRIVVYIEGDGFAWSSSSTPSTDPTPINPLALKLALQHPGGNAAYLARPCQYANTSVRICEQRYWTQSRFAPEVITATSLALDQLKGRFQAKRLTLVGYSGGGAVAALVAARREDVDQLITVAGNLDHTAWTTLHRLTPLRSSLNPADEVSNLQQVKQWHFVGGKDKIMPSALAQVFVDRFPAGNRPVLHIEENFNHYCCWADSWSRLYNDIR